VEAAVNAYERSRAKPTQLANADALEAAMPLLYEQFEEEVRERLLSKEARRIAGKAAFEAFDPTGDFDLLEEALQMAWEGNTAAGIEALLDFTLPTPEEGER
jgi:hypothetical protein